MASVPFSLPLHVQHLRRRARPYLQIAKLKGVGLMTFTAVVGMYLASPGFIPWAVLVFGTAGIVLVAAAAAACNQWMERHVDALMARTRHRPLPRGTLTSAQVLTFTALSALAGMTLIAAATNGLTVALSVVGGFGYAIVYTGFLKRATDQNIVIGGAASALPPLVGWTAITGQLDPGGLLLFLIIFMWTPPHFWALAIHRREDYVQAGLPMLPVTRGVPYTRLNIFVYTLALLPVTLLALPLGLGGPCYLVAALWLGGRFIHFGYRLWRTGDDARYAMATFRFSITHLFGLFAALTVDHALASWWRPLLT
ncbi:MAG: heme o synthase [Candidatus Competibacterales bacterium]